MKKFLVLASVIMFPSVSALAADHSVPEISCSTCEKGQTLAIATVTNASGYDSRSIFLSESMKAGRKVFTGYVLGMPKVVVFEVAKVSSKKFEATLSYPEYIPLGLNAPRSSKDFDSNAPGKVIAKISVEYPVEGNIVTFNFPEIGEVGRVSVAFALPLLVPNLF